jgi:hypothetical protein
MKDVESSLDLGRITAAILYGNDRLAQQAPILIDHTHYLVEIDVAYEVGVTLCLVFQGYLYREHPEIEFATQRIPDSASRRKESL